LPYHLYSSNSHTYTHKTHTQLSLTLAILNFTKIFTRSFYARSSQKTENSVKLSVSFYTFGIYWQFHQHFMGAFFVQNFGAKKLQSWNKITHRTFQLCNFWCQNINEKHARITLMKMTPDEKCRYNNGNLKLARFVTLQR